MTRKRSDIKSFVVPNEIYEPFKQFCNDNQLNMSAVIRNLVQKFMKEQEENKRSIK